MAKIKEASAIVRQIQEALGELEVRGRKNAALLVFSIDKCGELTRTINELIAEEQERKTNEAAETQESKEE